MTSLAQQLKKLTVPHVQVTHSSGKVRSSLLFDPKEAASQDFEEVYQIGYEAFEILCDKDDSLWEFKSVLFNESSATFQRTLQGTEVNRKLDENLTKFLVHISPKFLLHATHCVFEWLLYKYQIHKHNIDEIMFCVLPHHTENIFIRVLQLLQIGDPKHSWHWLSGCAKAGVPLTKEALVKHCHKNPSFLKTLENVAKKFIEVHGSEGSDIDGVINLHVSVLYCLVADHTNLNESLLSDIMRQFISPELNNCESWRSGMYKCIARLAINCTLNAVFVGKLMLSLLKSMSVNQLPEVLFTINVLCHTQPPEKLSKKLTKKLCSCRTLIDALGTLSSIYNTDTLMKLLMSRLIVAGLRTPGCSFSSGMSDDGAERFEDDNLTVNYNLLLMDFLTDLTFSREVALHVACEFLQRFVLLYNRFNKHEEMAKHDTQNWEALMAEILPKLERKYPTAIENAFTKLSNTLSEAERVSLHKVLQIYWHHPCQGTSVRGKMCSTAAIAINIKHPHAERRLATLQQLTATTKNDGELNAAVTDLVMSCFHDDDTGVVTAAVDLVEYLRPQVKDKELTDALIRVHGRAKKNNLKELTTLVLQQLTANIYNTSEDLRIIAHLVPAFYAHYIDQKNQGVLHSIAKSDLVKRYLPNCSVKGSITQDEVKVMNRTNAKAFAADFLALDESCQQAILAHTPVFQKWDKLDRDSLIFWLLVLVEALPQTDNVEKQCGIMGKILTLVTNASVTLSENTLVKPTNVTAADGEPCDTQAFISLVAELGIDKNNQMLSLVVPWGLTAVLHRLAMVDLPKGWLTSVSPLVQLHRRLISVAIAMTDRSHVVNKSVTSLWSAVLAAYTTEGLLSDGSLQRFLCYLMTLHSQLLVQHTGAVLLCDYIQMLPAEQLEALVDNKETFVFPSLLASLGHPSPHLRQKALKSFSRFHNHVSKSTLVPLINTVHRRKEEIAADCNFISQLMDAKVMKAKTDDKRKHIQQVCVYLLCVCGDETYPVWLRERLVWLLQAAPAEMVLERLCKIAATFLPPVTKMMNEPQLEILKHVLSRINSKTASLITVKSEMFNLIKKCLNIEWRVDSNGDNLLYLASRQITYDTFKTLPDLATKHAMLAMILDILMSCKSTEGTHVLTEVLAKLRLQHEHVVSELSLPDRKEKTVKKNKNKPVETAVNWRRVTYLLEVLQSRHKYKDTEGMVQLMFQLLARLNKESDEDADYRKRLVLTCIHTIVARWIDKSLQPKQETMSMECLTDCVRNGSMMTQQQALMVLSQAAEFHPNYVLHNIMSIFTFVGKGLMRQDDQHSLQVITQAIQRLVPTLIEASREVNKKDKTRSSIDPSVKESESLIVARVVQVFVDVRGAMPKQRSLSVFDTLVHVLKPQSYLWAVLTLIVQAGVVTKVTSEPEQDQSSKLDLYTQDNEKSPGMAGILEALTFATRLASQFTIVDQINALNKVIIFLEKLTAHNGAIAKSSSKPDALVAAMTVNMSGRDIRMFQYNLTKYVGNLLGDPLFIEQVLTESTLGTVPEFESVFEESMRYNLAITNQKFAQKANDAYWSAVINKAYVIREKVNYLLPLDRLLEVVHSLLTKDTLALRRKTLEMLFEKLNVLQPEDVTQSRTKSLLKITEQLISICKQSNLCKTTAQNETPKSSRKRKSLHLSPHNDTSMTSSASQMTAHLPTTPSAVLASSADEVAYLTLVMFNAKLLCRLLAEKHSDMFIKLLPLAVSLIRDAVPVRLMSAAIHCIAELCAVLGVRVIGQLKVFVPVLFSILSEEQYISNDTILSAGLTTLNKLFTHLPLFLTPYLKHTLMLMSRLSKRNMQEKTNQRYLVLRKQIGTVFNPRVLVPLLTDSYLELVEQDQTCLIPLLNIAKDHMDSISSSDLNAEKSTIAHFFCTAFNIRNHAKQMAAADTENIESAAIDAYMPLVVKMSENTFKPEFIKMYDYCCRDDSPETRERMITFFTLTYRLSEKLQSLFNLFVGHTLASACKILDANNTKNGTVKFFGKDSVAAAKSCALVNAILRTINSCLSFDREDLVTLDVYKLMAKPLLSQLENKLGSEDLIDKRLSELLVPCLSEFIVASKASDMSKDINYDICLMTRNKSPKVRLVALQILEAASKKYGQEYVVFIPEILSFLSELMEDEDPEVEKQCQTTIKTFESTCGVEMNALLD